MLNKEYLKAKVNKNRNKELYSYDQNGPESNSQIRIRLTLQEGIEILFSLIIFKSQHHILRYCVKTNSE